MSKNIKIAALGIAALAAAVAPATGVFAFANTQTDTLSIELAAVCSFGYRVPAEGTPTTIDVSAPGHENSLGTWSGNTLNTTMANGTTNNTLGTTTLHVYCNDSDGYTITSSFGTQTENHVGALVSGSNYIDANTGFSTSTTGWAYKVNSVGNVTAGQDGTPATAADTWNATAGLIVKNTAKSAATGDNYTITYGAGISTTQDAGTYTGTITYTLTAI